MELTHEVLFQLALSYHRMNFKGRRVIHYPSELFSRHLFSHNCWPLFYPYNLNVFLRSINIIYIYIYVFLQYTYRYYSNQWHITTLQKQNTQTFGFIIVDENRHRESPWVPGQLRKVLGRSSSFLHQLPVRMWVVFYQDVGMVLW